MRTTRALFGLAIVPLLSGCMMLPMAHTGGLVGLTVPAQSETDQDPATLLQAVASDDDLAIVLSYRTPIHGTTAFDAQLRSDGGDDELANADIRLRIQSPDGGVEQLRMQRIPSHATAWYRVQYRFPAFGSYLVTAEARTGVGPVRTVAVTTEVTVQTGSRRDQRNWLVPAAIVGGLGTMAWMAFMMGGSWF